MRLIALEKLTAVQHPAFPTPPWDRYEVGTINPTTSLPSGYCILGYLIGEIEIGHPVRILRTNRNGVESFGIFTSSPVTALSDNTFATSNSVYEYRFLEEL